MDLSTWQRLNRGIETNGTNVPDHVQQQVYALVNKAPRKKLFPTFFLEIQRMGCSQFCFLFRNGDLLLVEDLLIFFLVGIFFPGKWDPPFISPFLQDGLMMV